MNDEKKYVYLCEKKKQFHCDVKIQSHVVPTTKKLLIRYAIAFAIFVILTALTLWLI